ncbi:MAG: efflux transporter outer membrane subunit [Lautropia sp.]|nr:efflux transporter outer membrane subunit [Lautropia sp.]
MNREALSAVARPAPLCGLLASLLLALGGCSVMPAYQQPESAVQAPLAQAQDGWHLVQTRGEDGVGLLDDALFDDAQLRALLSRLRTDNLSVLQAEARLRAAQAVLSGAGASRLPQLGVDVGGTRGSASARGSTLGSSSSDTTGSSSGSTRRGVQNQVEAGARISWAPDLWGTVAAQMAASRASVQVAGAEQRAALLQAQISLVQAWWRMRLAESQLALLARSIATSERSLALTRNQYQAGLVARADVLQAETRLQSVRTRRHALMRSRDTERHAIAVLVGLPPAALPAIQPGPLPAVPALPAHLAIDLLRRRPDLRAAEQQVVAANAEIGVARGAWLPTLSFSGTYGLGAETLANLISSPLRTWSLGTQLAATLFDGGARTAALRQKEAAYDERVAAWRQQVLSAVQEVDDGLLALRTQAAQADDQAHLVALAAESERVVRNRYKGGLVSYLELAIAEASHLDAQEQALSLQAERLASYTSLLAALGGSW